jgi:isoprenylcysteine carboxyl methyltransferase (ICMT) family protein YpbQ
MWEKIYKKKWQYEISDFLLIHICFLLSPMVGVLKTDQLAVAILMIMTVLTFKTDVILYIFMTRKSLKKKTHLLLLKRKQSIKLILMKLNESTAS